MENYFRRINDNEFRVLEKAVNRMFRDYKEHRNTDNKGPHPNFPPPNESFFEEEVLVAFTVDLEKEFVTALVIVDNFLYVGSTKRMYKDDFDFDIGKTIALSRAVRAVPIDLSP